MYITTKVLYTHVTYIQMRMSYRNNPVWSVWSKDTLEKDDLRVTNHIMPVDIARSVIENADKTETVKLGAPLPEHDEDRTTITYAALDESGVMLIDGPDKTEAKRVPVDTLGELVNWTLWRQIESLHRHMEVVPYEVTDWRKNSLLRLKRVSEESGIRVTQL